MIVAPEVGLAEYDRHKFALADVLRAIAAQRPRAPGERDETVQQLYARIAEDRFNLVVVGRFSRGKSSLMNAIMGEAWLPTGIAPLTSVITAVSYGSEPAVELTFHDRGWRQRVGLDELPTFVTQQGNPGNAKRLKLAEIQLPAEILRRGFYFIDTPGLGSHVSANSETTADFLPEADAFLLVTSFDGPLSAEEDRFLRAFAPTGRQIFVAVNKQDTVGAAQRAEVLQYVRDHLASLAAPTAPQVFATSATAALAAKLAGDAAALEASGVAALETALADFLVTRKRGEFLMNLADRIEALAGSAGGDGERRQWVERIEAVRRQASIGAAPRRLTASTRAGAERAGSCDVCGAIQNAAFDHIRHLQYDITISEDARRGLVQSGGLCPLHTWWYEAIASPHGVSIGFPPLLEVWSGRLAQLAEADLAGAELAETIRAHLGTSAGCPVCKSCVDAGQRRIDALACALAGPDARPPESLSAICLPHLAELLPHVEEEAMRRRLLARQASLLERVAEDMRGYAVKFDGLRRSLLSDSESAAAARGLRLLSGAPNISFARKPG